MPAGFSATGSFLDTRRKPANPGACRLRSDGIGAGLVGCWLLNEGGGSTAWDISTSRANGTLTNSPIYNPGNFGANGLLLDSASSQYINCGTSLNSSNASISAAGWVKSTSSANAQYVINKDYDGLVAYSLGVGGNPTVQGFSFFDGGSWRSSGITTDIRNDGKWHHIVGTWDGAKSSYYIDGKLDSSATPGGTRTTSAGTGVVTIGAYLHDNAYWKGNIDNVQLWNRAISAAEVAYLYTNPFAILQPQRAVRYGSVAGGVQTFQPAWAANSNRILTGGVI